MITLMKKKCIKKSRPGESWEKNFEPKEKQTLHITKIRARNLPKHCTDYLMVQAFK